MHQPNTGVSRAEARVHNDETGSKGILLPGERPPELMVATVKSPLPTGGGVFTVSKSRSLLEACAFQALGWRKREGFPKQVVRRPIPGAARLGGEGWWSETGFGE